MGNSTNNSLLKPFFNEINKYSEGVHSLNSGVDLKEIELLEKQLNIKLPLIYKDFLQVCNGGEIFIPGTVLAQVYQSSKGLMVEGESYLNESFKMERRWPQMLDEYLIIADINYGDVVCMDLSKSNGIDTEVVQWNHEIGTVSRKWNSFVDWLMSEMDEGSQLVDYDGEDKD